MNKKLFLVSAMIAGFVLILTGQVTAQTFTTLHSFTNDYSGHSDGAYPRAGLILSGNTLYGTTYQSSYGVGTVFKLNTDGTSYTKLHSFNSLNDGANPQAVLILSGNNLYGTAYAGGKSGNGTIFKLNTDGTGFTTLHNFTEYVPVPNTDGGNPTAGLVLSGNTLYGAASSGGSGAGSANLGSGTIFKLKTDGTGFATMYNFSAYSGSLGVNSDGGGPNDLVLSGDGTIYGTTSFGGNAGVGALFLTSTNGGFSPMGYFTGSFSGNANVRSGLILSGNTLYGTTTRGGSNNVGTVFKVSSSGWNITALHNFSARSSSYTNSDGASPCARLILSGSKLYGTAQIGGNYGYGTIFAVNTDGTGFTTLYSFTGGGDGANPQAELILSGTTLYGTAFSGGIYGSGTVFSLDMRTPLFFAKGSNQFVFTWTNANFSLQSAPAITGTFINIPGAISPYTNRITGSQQFFRLIQN